MTRGAAEGTTDVTATSIRRLQAEVLALSVLKQVMEEKVTKTNVDIASVAPTYHLYSEAEVQGVIDRL